jgi:hypothetical protein
MHRTIAFVGHGRHGKDECCRLWAEITGGVNAGTLSKYLTPVVGQYMEAVGLPADPDICDFEQRHLHRDIWRAAGDWYRQHDPARLVKDALMHGNITGGIRGDKEIWAARPLLDLIVWVQRPGYGEDPTMDYGMEEADVVIYNDGSLKCLESKLRRMYNVAGIR